MKQLKFDPTPYFGVTTLMTISKSWEKNFLNETSKFISATLLNPEDLGQTFKDHMGEDWKILGMTEGREMPCEKVSTGEIFLWDRWKVSLLKRPYEHHRLKQKAEYITKEPVKPTRGRKSSESKEPAQLSLFGEVAPTSSTNVTITSARYGVDTRVLDVTSKVSDLFKKGEKIKVSNHLGSDPAPGVVKTLVIEYNMNGESFTKTFPEKSLVIFK
jgi:hypothetical protein